MNSPSVDIIDYLESLSVGTVAATSGWSLNASKEPSEPDTTITIYDTPNAPSDPDNDLFNAACQIRLRGHAFETVYNKAEEVRDALIDNTGLTIGGTLYVGFWVTNGPETLEYDDNDRVILIMNFNILRQRV